jgi:hypothetical protein
MGAGAAAGGGVGFVSAARAFVRPPRASLAVLRADSVLDSIGTGVPRDFVSAGPRGSAGTRGSAGPGLASAAAAGGVAVGLDGLRLRRRHLVRRYPHPEGGRDRDHAAAERGNGH